MSEVRRKFSALTAASPLEDADVVPVVQNADYATDIATYNPNGAVWTPVMSGGGPPALVAKAA